MKKENSFYSLFKRDWNTVNIQVPTTFDEQDDQKQQVKKEDKEDNGTNRILTFLTAVFCWI